VPKNRAISAKPPNVKESPNGRKFAQSGHPDVGRAEHRTYLMEESEGHKSRLIHQRLNKAGRQKLV
jgi:hypothetical protein